MTYECSNGHWISTPDKKLTQCLAHIHGKRCEGTLKRPRKTKK